MTSLRAEREQVPAEAAHDRARQRVERADEQAVIDRAFPAAMEARLDRKPLRNDLHTAEAAQHGAEFADAELAEHRRIVMLETDLHELRERIQPRDAVVNLEDCLAAR